MTDYTKMMELLDKYNIDFHLSWLYNESNVKCGYEIQLDKGDYIEFDLDGKLTNIVNY